MIVATPLLNLPANPGGGIAAVRGGKSFLGYSILFLLFDLLCLHSFFLSLFISGGTVPQLNSSATRKIFLVIQFK